MDWYRTFGSMEVVVITAFVLFYGLYLLRISNMANGNTFGKIEGELREARFVDVTANKYFYFLAIAGPLVLLDIITT